MVPFLLLMIFYFVDPNYIMPLFTTTLGILALCVVVVLQIIGGLAIRKVVSIKV